ncbi:UDP-glycosyltransferase UGT5-like [Neocloeon triangulifer]|uniref:UDP-glycosyltransferase UGT5-like n=1 Tax=Neocloeon triangulifer TaxID=2078957 RepID=UPI00286EC6CB|nr:UDP-glycosyltransferase UGT5-like [Neocloeon triangulifer]
MLVNFAICFLLVFAGHAECDRILGLFPYPSRSHLSVYSTLTKALAARGHELVVVSPYPLANPPSNYTDVDTMPAVKAFHDAVFSADVYEFADFPLHFILTSFWDEGLMVTDAFLQYEKVQNLLKDKRGFDLVIAEAFIDEAVYTFAQHFKAPLILISSMNGLHWINYAVGNPTPWSYYPNPMLTYIDRMDFSERLRNFLFSAAWDLGNQLHYFPKQNQLQQKYFGSGYPDVREIQNSVSLILLNAHFTMTFPRPLVPAIVEVGGMHVSPKNKKLPEDMQQFLDGATEGAIYFSMGSNLRSDLMPAEKIQQILAAFAKIPQRVLWKWESENLPNQPPNVKIGKWMPQQDILAHPNVRVFITHGGLLSAQEAAFHGVALIGIPIFGDQMLNVKQAERAGYAVVVNYQNISQEAFSWAIERALHDERIQTEAKRRARVVRDQPQTPLERAVFWTEYVLRHKGAPHLQSAAVSLEWYQLNLLDVYVFIASVLLSFAFLLRFCLQKLIRACSRAKVKSE